MHGRLRWRVETSRHCCATCGGESRLRGGAARLPGEQRDLPGEQRDSPCLRCALAGSRCSLAHPRCSWPFQGPSLLSGGEALSRHILRRESAHGHPRRSGDHRGIAAGGRGGPGSPVSGGPGCGWGRGSGGWGSGTGAGLGFTCAGSAFIIVFEVLPVSQPTRATVVTMAAAKIGIGDRIRFIMSVLLVPTDRGATAVPGRVWRACASPPAIGPPRRREHVPLSPPPGEPASCSSPGRPFPGGHNEQGWHAPDRQSP
jgi:hypothetical protein